MPWCLFSVLLRKPGGMPTASFRGHDLTVRQEHAHANGGVGMPPCIWTPAR